MGTCKTNSRVNNKMSFVLISFGKIYAIFYFLFFCHRYPVLGNHKWVPSIYSHFCWASNLKCYSPFHSIMYGNILLGFTGWRFDVCVISNSPHVLINCDIFGNDTVHHYQSTTTSRSNMYIMKENGFLYFHIYCVLHFLVCTSSFFRFCFLFLL